MIWLNNNNNIQVKALETVLLIIIMSVVAVLGLYHAPYLLLLFPAPFIVFSIKNGITSNIINMIITCVVVGIIDSPGYGLFFLVIFVPVTFVLSYFIKNRKSNVEILGISSAVLFISILIILNFTDVAGINFVNKLEVGFNQVLKNQLEIVQDMDLTSYQFLKVKDLLEETYKLALLTIPAGLLVMSLGVSYLNYLFTAIGLSKVGISIVNIPKFSKFRLPNNIIPGIIIMFVASLIMERIKIPYSRAILINLITLVGFMFFLQGISVIDFFFKRFIKYPIVRFIIILMLLFNRSTILILTILGFIDGVFDLRKIKRPRSQ